MKNINSQYIFFLIIIILISDSYSNLNFHFPFSITLANGNILVIEKEGIYICDPSLKSIINTILIFDDEDKIKDEKSYSNVILKDKNGFIIGMVNYKVYLLTRTGELLKSTNRLILDDDPTYFTLAPIFVKNNTYYFVIGYFTLDINLKFLYYKINLIDYQNTLITSIDNELFKGFQSMYSYNYLNRGLSCEYMASLEKYLFKVDYDYYLVCFLMIDDNGDSMVQDFYEVNEDSISHHDRYMISYTQINNTYLIKSITNNDIKKALICLFRENDNSVSVSMYIFQYEYIATSLEVLPKIDIQCIKNDYGIKINYIHEKDEIFFSCINPAGFLNSILLKNSFEIIQYNKQFETCESIFGHSIIYSIFYNEYYIISDAICDKYQRTFIPLIGDIPKIEEEENELEKQ